MRHQQQPAQAQKLLGKARSRKDLITCETMVKKGWATRSNEPLTGAERKELEALTKQAGLRHPP